MLTQNKCIWNIFISFQLCSYDTTAFSLYTYNTITLLKSYIIYTHNTMKTLIMQTTENTFNVAVFVQFRLKCILELSPSLQWPTYINISYNNTIYSNKIKTQKKSAFLFKLIFPQKESTSGDWRRIKRHVGATATRRFAFVRTHINHSGLLRPAQKLGTMAGKQWWRWEKTVLAQQRPLPRTFPTACVSSWGADKWLPRHMSAQSKHAGGQTDETERERQPPSPSPSRTCKRPHTLEQDRNSGKQIDTPQGVTQRTMLLEFFAIINFCLQFLKKNNCRNIYLWGKKQKKQGQCQCEGQSIRFETAIVSCQKSRNSPVVLEDLQFFSVHELSCCLLICPAGGSVGLWAIY